MEDNAFNLDELVRKYICYTDGSYQSSINAGGWCSIILTENEQLVTKLYQGRTHTTNNRMELMAILETLRYFEEPSELIIISDSQYVINGINGSAKKWFEDNDLSKKNLDLWFEVVELLDKHKVTMEWTKGHAGNKWNEEADRLCVFAAQCYNLPRDIWTTDLELND